MKQKVWVQGVESGMAVPEKLGINFLGLFLIFISLKTYNSMIFQEIKNTFLTVLPSVDGGKISNIRNIKSDQFNASSNSFRMSHIILYQKS